MAQALPNEGTNGEERLQVEGSLYHKPGQFR